MSLGLTNYNALNGLGLITGATSGYGYGGYGGLYASDAYVENAKKSMANSYDLSTTRQSFTGKQSTEAMTFTEHCQTIQYMLQEGRSDDALFEFNNMVNEMEEPDRMIFIRRYYYVERIRCIAEAVGLSEKAVERRLARGRARLRDALLKEGVILDEI